jgi:hypothetical protein
MLFFSSSTSDKTFALVESAVESKGAGETYRDTQETTEKPLDERNFSIFI